MKIDVKLGESNQSFSPQFGETRTMSNGEFEKGYAAGEAAGYSQGHTDGFAQGKEAECNRFWDVYQANGTRTNYAYAFGRGWTDAIFSPKYDIVSDNCSNMFLNAELQDLEGALEKAGVTLNTENATNFSYMFNLAKVEVIPHLNLSKAKNIAYMFNGCSALRKVSLTFPEKNTITNTSYVFAGCGKLEDLTIYGPVHDDLYLFEATSLNKASIARVIGALSSAVSNGHFVLSMIAVRNAFGSTTAEEWTTLIGTKPNWTILLQ